VDGHTSYVLGLAEKGHDNRGDNVATREENDIEFTPWTSASKGALSRRKGNIEFNDWPSPSVCNSPPPEPSERSDDRMGVDGTLAVNRTDGNAVCFQLA
jgi:hypothetical protein